MLGDRHYNTDEVRAVCQASARTLVASRYGRYPHTDAGAEARRVFHKLRSAAIENFNGQFKAIFDVHGPVPTRGLTNTRRFALGAVLVYQLTLWHRHEHGLDLRVGLDPFLESRLTVYYQASFRQRAAKESTGGLSQPALCSVRRVVVLS